MKKIIAIVMCLLIAVSLTGCGGSGDELKGKWKGKTENYGEATWEFDGDGKVVFTFSLGKYGNSESKGTYKDEGDGKLTINYFNDKFPYTYEIKDGKLTLTCVNKLAPSAKNMEKVDK